jgi:hypothetical protein
LELRVYAARGKMSVSVGVSVGVRNKEHELKELLTSNYFSQGLMAVAEKHYT